MTFSFRRPRSGETFLATAGRAWRLTSYETPTRIYGGDPALASETVVGLPGRNGIAGNRYVGVVAA